MYAFNRRLRAKEVLGMPVSSFGGTLVAMGGLSMFIMFPVFVIKFFFIPVIFFGIILIRKGFRERGEEHLLLSYISSSKDLKAKDKGL